MTLQEILFVALAAMLLAANAASADVLNMGGTRNADGSWTGLASLETVSVGDLGNTGGPSAAWATPTTSASTR